MPKGGTPATIFQSRGKLKSLARQCDGDDANSLGALSTWKGRPILLQRGKLKAKGSYLTAESFKRVSAAKEEWRAFTDNPGLVKALPCLSPLQRSTQGS